MFLNHGINELGELVSIQEVGSGRAVNTVRKAHDVLKIKGRTL